VWAHRKSHVKEYLLDSLLPVAGASVQTIQQGLSKEPEIAGLTHWAAFGGHNMIMVSSFGRYDCLNAFLQLPCFSRQLDWIIIKVMTRELLSLSTGSNFSLLAQL
jgi:hypothetical protein